MWSFTNSKSESDADISYKSDSIDCCSVTFGHFHCRDGIVSVLCHKTCAKPTGDCHQVLHLAIKAGLLSLSGCSFREFHIILILDAAAIRAQFHISIGAECYRVAVTAYAILRPAAIRISICELLAAKPVEILVGAICSCRVVFCQRDLD